MFQLCIFIRLRSRATKRCICKENKTKNENEKHKKTREREGGYREEREREKTSEASEIRGPYLYILLLLSVSSSSKAGQASMRASVRCIVSGMQRILWDVTRLPKVSPRAFFAPIRYSGWYRRASQLSREAREEFYDCPAPRQYETPVGDTRRPRRTRLPRYFCAKSVR